MTALGSYESRIAAKAHASELITTMQRRLGGMPAFNRSRRDYLRCARWWELEAMRGYPSSASSREYAVNMRWAAEVAFFHGPGTWLELKARTSDKSK